MGVFLILTGIAFMTGFITNMAIWFQETFPILMQIG
jgi:cytochrome c-type biogenesis protein